MSDLLGAIFLTMVTLPGLEVMRRFIVRFQRRQPGTASDE